MKVFKFILCSFFGLTATFAQVKPKQIKVANQIYGDLYKQEAQKLIIIVPTSGTADRNGTIEGHETNMYKDLAQNLVSPDYDVFTYDKRMAFLSKNKSSLDNINFDHNIVDLKAVINYYKGKYQKIVLVAHGEGSLVASEAGKGAVEALIIINGLSIPVDQVLHNQIAKKYPELSQAVKNAMAQYKQGNRKTDNPILDRFFTEDKMNYLLDLLKYDPISSIKAMNVPVLVLASTEVPEFSYYDRIGFEKISDQTPIYPLEDMDYNLKLMDPNDIVNSLGLRVKAPLHPKISSYILDFLNSNEI